jgi:hypothetical protein
MVKDHPDNGKMEYKKILLVLCRVRHLSILNDGMNISKSKRSGMILSLFTVC